MKASSNEIPSGTRLHFQQVNAPNGWTKIGTWGPMDQWVIAIKD